MMDKYNIESYEAAGQQPLGEGREKVVFVSPDDPEKVVNIIKEGAESSELVKGRFYLTKILHILYPQHIPDMYVSASEPHIMERERIQGTESLKKSNDVLKDRLFGLGISLDSNPRNYMAEDEDSPARYVDTVLTWYRDGTPNYDAGKLKEAIFNLNEPERTKALSYLERLQDLNTTARKGKEIT
ncbi:MAG: hypothetical protein WD889_03275 [Candidatus Colwellbacteria bacterium]